MADEIGASDKGYAGVFGRGAATFDRIGQFAHFGERLVICANVTEGDRVLDVATGRGAVAFPAAKRVGAHGRVVGIDIAQGMLQETAKDLASGNWPNIELQQMDAEHLQYSDASFDCVLCGFALWFFPHPAEALREFHRVLKPAGRLAVTTWAYDSPWHNLIRETARSHAHVTFEATQRFDTMEQLGMALRTAGFVDSDVLTEDYTAVVERMETLWEALWSGGFRRNLEGLPEPALDAVKAAYFGELSRLRQLNGIHVGFRALVAVSTKQD